MNRAALLLFLALAGCGDVNKLWQESEIQAIADSAVDAEATFRTEQDRVLFAKIHELETRLKAIEKKMGVQDAYASAISKDLDAVVDLVSNNARVANENALAELNRRNACHPRECTLKDLQR